MHYVASDDTSVGAQSLSHQVRDALAQQIVSGALEPGSRLVETKLAATFGTSQAPIREALRELNNFGLVEVRPRRGTFVGTFVHQTLSESYVVRAALEEAATRLIMTNETVPTGLLDQDVEMMVQAASQGDSEAMVANVVAFHRHIVEASGNELLRRSWEALHIAGRTRVLLTTSGSSLDEVVHEHAALLAGLKRHDIEAACREARDHQWQFAVLSQTEPFESVPPGQPR